MGLRGAALSEAVRRDIPEEVTREQNPRGRKETGSFWAEGTTGAKVRGHSAPGRAERQEKDG